MRVHAAPQIIPPSHRDRDLPRPPGRRSDRGAPAQEFPAPGNPAEQPGRAPATRRELWGTGIFSHPGVTPHAAAPLIAQQLHQLWVLQGLGYPAGPAADAYRRTAIPFASGGAGDISVTA